MNLSSNFKLSEFAQSATATRLGIKNEIPPHAIEPIAALVRHVLQPLRDATGWPTEILSGYRNPVLNKAVGGVPTSQHLVLPGKGAAADTKHRRLGKQVPPIEVARKAVALGLVFDQMIIYPTFVHFSYQEGRNRGQILYNKSYTGPKL